MPALVNPARAVIVHIRHLIAQTASIAEYNLHTPDTAAAYRYSIYLLTHAAGVAGTVQATIKWSDEAISATTASTSTINLANLGDRQVLTGFLQAKVGIPVTLSAAVVGRVGGSYDLLIVLEKLM